MEPSRLPLGYLIQHGADRVTALQSLLSDRVCPELPAAGASGGLLHCQSLAGPGQWFTREHGRQPLPIPSPYQAVRHP